MLMFQCDVQQIGDLGDWGWNWMGIDEIRNLVQKYINKKITKPQIKIYKDNTCGV